MYTACIVAHVPTTGKVLGEPRDITAVGIHEAEVTIGLKQGCGQLCAWLYGGCFCVVGVHFLQITVAAGGRSGQAETDDASDEVFLDILNIHNFFSSFLEFNVNIETIAAA